jgi:hypothetical protein
MTGSKRERRRNATGLLPVSAYESPKTKMESYRRPAASSGAAAESVTARRRRETARGENGLVAMPDAFNALTDGAGLTHQTRWRLSAMVQPLRFQPFVALALECDGAATTVSAIRRAGA